MQWIAAVNSGKQFTGTYKLDLAQLYRFAVLKIDYPPECMQAQILAARYDMVRPKRIKKVVHIANLIRRDEAITTDLSMCATDEACLFLSYPTLQRQLSDADLLAILKTSFCNRLPGSVDEEGSEAHRLPHHRAERPPERGRRARRRGGLAVIFDAAFKQARRRRDAIASFAPRPDRRARPSRRGAGGLPATAGVV